MVVHPKDATESKTAHARAVARGFAQRLGSTPIGVLWSRLFEVEFVDRSVALAAKLFVSFFPLLIVAAAVARAGVHQAIVAVVMDRLGVSGEALDMVQQAFASPEATKAATGILGVLLALAYAVSFTTALQRVYLPAWRRPPGGGVRNKGRGALWVGGVLVYIVLLATVRDLIGGTTGTLSTWLLSALAGTLLWWWTARLMLRGEVRWRPLLPTAALTALGTSFYAMAADVWDAGHGHRELRAVRRVRHRAVLRDVLHRHGVRHRDRRGDRRGDRARPGGSRRPCRSVAPRPRRHPAGTHRPKATARARPAGPIGRRVRPRRPRVGGRPSSPGRVAGAVVPPDPLTGLQPPDLVQHVPPGSGPRIFPESRHGPPVSARPVLRRNG